MSDDKEDKKMETKKSTSREEPLNSDRSKATGKDVFIRKARSCREKRPGLITALILHHARCLDIIHQT